MYMCYFVNFVYILHGLNFAAQRGGARRPECTSGVFVPVYVYTSILPAFAIWYPGFDGLLVVIADLTVEGTYEGRSAHLCKLRLGIHSDLRIGLITD